MAVSQQRSNRTHLLRDIEGSDVVFIVGEERFYCHREVFTESKGFFKALFGKSFSEHKQKNIYLNDIMPEIFSSIRYYMYGVDINRVLSWENIVLMYHHAKMYCLEDLKLDVLKFITDNLTGDKCWELCNAVYSRETKSELMEVTLEWICKHIPNPSIQMNFKNASKEVALLFLNKCLNENEDNPYPLSMIELWEWTSFYESENKHTLDCRFLTNNLPGLHAAVVSRDHLNSHPFPLSEKDILSIEPFRSMHFNNNAETLKAYWDKTDRLFRIYFDHNATVWQLTISTSNAPVQNAHPPNNQAEQRSVALTMGPLRLATRSGIESSQSILRGTTITILNRSPLYSEQSEDLSDYVSELHRGEKLRIFLPDLAWSVMMDPTRGFLGKDKVGVHLMVKILFPVIWDEKPTSDWWSEDSEKKEK